MAQLVKNPSAIQETGVWSLGWEIPWRRDPVFWPGEFHGLYSPWGRKAPGTTEWLALHFTPLDEEYIYTGEMESSLWTMTFLTKAWIPLGPVFLLPPFHGWSSLSNPWAPLLSPLGLEIIEYHVGNLFTPSHIPPGTAGWVRSGLDAVLHCSYLTVSVHFLSNT